MVLNQPTREGQQAARHRQAERLQAESAHLDTFYNIRTQFAHAPSAPELLWRVLGRATVCCSSSATPTNSSTSRAAMALCPCSFARCFRIASNLATNALNGHVTSNVPSLSHRSTLGPRDRTGSSMPPMGHILLPHHVLAHHWREQLLRRFCI